MLKTDQLVRISSAFKESVLVMALDNPLAVQG
jgi:hypothetical protein